MILILADATLALSSSIAATLAGIALWGLHLGFTQGLLATLVAEETPADMKGTAFGLFNLVSGLCLLLASVLAGWMWDRHGSASTFASPARWRCWRWPPPCCGASGNAALAGLNPDRGGHRGDQAVRGRAPLPPPDAQGLGISLRAGQGSSTAPPAAASTSEAGTSVTPCRPPPSARCRPTAAARAAPAG